MTEPARNSAYLHIEERLESVGRKYRLQRLMRGLMLFAAIATIASILAAFLAHLTAQSAGPRIILLLWTACLIVSASLWLAKPLLIRPKALEMAQLVESRVPGLNNGLTNGLLLANRADLSDSIWLPQIFKEIADTAARRPLGEAVKMGELRPPALRLAALLVPMVVMTLFLPHQFAHGWQQLFHPESFVPKIGAAQIIDVQPGDVTLIAGEPLEISVTAKCPPTAAGAPAKLIFDRLPKADASFAGPTPTNAQLSPVARQGATDVVGFSYRIDHLDTPLRYRVEVAGTQSGWFTATLVKRVKLVSLTLNITPPSYTGLPERALTLAADDLAKTPLTLVQGSVVQAAARVDVPVGGAMLQTDQSAPTPMKAGSDQRQFAATFTIMDEMPLAVLLTDGMKQIIARLPEDPLIIHCLRDTPPVIDMRWPTQDVTVAPQAELNLAAMLRDDYGIVSARVLLATAADAPLTAVHEEQFAPGAGVKKPQPFNFVIPVESALRMDGNLLRVQIEATDNRALPDLGPQTSRSPIFQVRFQDPAELAKQQQQQIDQLRDRLNALLKQQRELHEKTLPLLVTTAAQFQTAAARLATIHDGQRALQTALGATAQTFPFRPDDRIVQKTLFMLAVNPAQEAVDFSASLQIEPLPPARARLKSDLEARQRLIISTLESLLAVLNTAAHPATQPAEHPHDDLLSRADAFKKLDDALKKFMEQQQRVLDQTASLAKKPVDQWDDNDRKKLDGLKMAQENLDAFMQQAVSDFSKNSDQDMANSSMLKDLMQVYSEVTMARDALSKQAAEIAVADEDMGLESAKELSSNIEKWLGNSPDRTKWTQEDPTGKTDTPMPELPKELEDMVGQLLEHEEDLFDQVEDANANWADSGDKALGMEAADGPIADMSAKGVTGNTLPNNNEMNGRSGEGRQGKSQGEFVGDTAVGKGGRRTPTRLDPTPFAQGQVKDQSTDPGGGATGGGKLSGQGGQGLEGPVPPKVKEEMQRLAQKQAELRNTAERLNLQYHLSRYDNFKLAESIALMRRVESDLDANRYVNAMRLRDVTLDDLSTSRMMLGGELHVQQDTTPRTSQKLQAQINDAMKGELPPAWSDVLKAYYQKLGQP